MTNWREELEMRDRESELECETFNDNPDSE